MVTFERHDKDQRRAAGSFDLVGEVDDRFALALLHGELAATRQLAALAHDLAVVRHFQFIEDQLVLATAQIFYLHSLIRLDFLAVEVEHSRRGLILKLNVQHQLLSLHRDGVLQLLVEAIGVYNLYKKTHDHAIFFLEAFEDKLKKLYLLQFITISASVLSALLTQE